METLTQKLGKFKRVDNLKTGGYSAAANQYDITFQNGSIFQSYASIIVVKFNNGETYIGDDFDYSRTTMKYLNQFLGHNVAETRKRLKDGVYKAIN